MNGGWPAEAHVAFPVTQEDESEDTLTSSDDGAEDIRGPDTSNMGEHEAAEAIFFEYRRAKKVWRRFTGKPVRKFSSSEVTSGKEDAAQKEKAVVSTTLVTRSRLFSRAKEKATGSTPVAKGTDERGTPRTAMGSL